MRETKVIYAQTEICENPNTDFQILLEQIKNTHLLKTYEENTWTCKIIHFLFFVNSIFGYCKCIRSTVNANVASSHSILSIQLFGSLQNEANTIILSSFPYHFLSDQTKNRKSNSTEQNRCKIVKES